jgi:hypothetical protein
VPGALQFVVEALDSFEVHILSSRSHQWGGRRAMKRWLRDHLIAVGDVPTDLNVPSWWMNFVAENNHHEPWEHELRNAADLVVGRIKWPLFKPSAMVTIDDRALTFDGRWPAVQSLLAFRPWNKKRLVAM